MPKLDRNGVRVYYEAHGKGPVVLLSHGFAATSAMWRGQVEPLTRKHRLVIWDMRGHGQSDYPSDPAEYSEAATIGDMAALLDAVGAERAVVGGLSLGGYMSLAFHRRYPERVTALLVIDTGPGFRKDEPRQAWNERALRTAARYDAEGLAALGAGSAEVASSTHRSAEGLALAARGMLTQHDAGVIDSLPDIKVPSLVMVGAEDKNFLASADYMATKISGARKVVIPGAGHSSNLDQPAAFNQALVEFLDTVSR
ncbi:MAG TPA: alpha/beta fold hydrolase [Aliidongia sp.]|nr:alpha/beta fold hydrolase [Aliidongia sp.]